MMPDDATRRVDVPALLRRAENSVLVHLTRHRLSDVAYLRALANAVETWQRTTRDYDALPESATWEERHPARKAIDAAFWQLHTLLRGQFDHDINTEHAAHIGAYPQQEEQ
jgi:hypothetical protein